METPRSLVNPVALQTCSVKLGDLTLTVLDVSFLRLVVADPGEYPSETEALRLDFHLDRYKFSTETRFEGRGDGWIRLGFEKLLPSAGASLRSFLSPKRVGESIMEDWRTDEKRHYHGLNESELWFDENGSVVFGYLDAEDPTLQFMVRIPDNKGPLRVGKMTRKEYMGLSSLEGELPLVPLSDREAYTKLGECRDIVTNFRPTGQIEYNLKQRLLKVISETLYSTSRKVEMATPRAARVSTPPA